MLSEQTDLPHLCVLPPVTQWERLPYWTEGHQTLHWSRAGSLGYPMNPGPVFLSLFVMKQQKWWSLKETYNLRKWVRWMWLKNMLLLRVDSMNLHVSRKWVHWAFITNTNTYISSAAFMTHFKIVPLFPRTTKKDSVDCLLLGSKAAPKITIKIKIKIIHYLKLFIMIITFYF